MTNTMPTFVAAGVATLSNTPSVSGLTFRAGDLVIGVLFQGNSTPDVTFTVPDAWNIYTIVVDSSINPLVIAFAYVRPDGSLPTLTFTPSESVTRFTQVYQFRNAKIAAPFGASATGAGSSTTASCAAITSTDDNSLAVLFHANVTDQTSWPPAGWTLGSDGPSTSPCMAYVELADSGDSSPSYSQSLTVSANSWRAINIELLGLQTIASSSWFNGLPTGFGDGGQKYWFDGLPANFLTESGVEIIMPFLENVNVIYDPTLTPGAVTITPPLLTNTSVIYDPVFTSGAVPFNPPLLENTNVLYPPTISPGAVTLLMPLLDENDLVPPPSVNQDQFISPPLLTNVNGFFEHHFTTGPVTIEPPLLTNTNTLPSPELAVNNTLTPPLLENANTLFPPTFTTSYTIEVPLLTDDDTLFPPTLVGGGTIFPPLLVNTSILYPPAIQRVKGQGNGGGGGGGGTVTSDRKYASTLVMSEGGLITAVQTESSSAKTINTRMMIYEDSAGSPGALLATSETKTTVTVGINTYMLQTPLAVLGGTTLWIALHSDGNFNWFLQNAPGGARYNTDTFSDGASDPFGAASVDNKKSPLFVVFLESANAGITAPLLTNATELFAPTFSVSARDLQPPLVGESFLYEPTISATYNLEMPFVPNNEHEALPPLSMFGGPVDLDPPLLGNAAVPYPPALLSGMPPGTELSPTLLTDADELFTPTLFNDLQIIEPPLVDAGAAPLAPSLELDYVLAPDDVESTTELFPPAFTTSSRDLQPPLCTNPAQEIFDPSLTRQDGFMQPPLLDNANVLYPPSLRRPRRAHRVVIQGSSGAGPRVAGTLGRDVAIEGDASGLDIQLEGSDA